jgi:hypothetical protein
MNRPATLQIDTLEQRARAFGYRSNLLPYCQFFATKRTIKLLVGIVHTEDDLRTSLRDALDRGKSVRDWSREIGLLLPAGAKASRSNVLPALSSYSPDGDWQSLRRPSLRREHLDANLEKLKYVGLFEFPRVQFGRMTFNYGVQPVSVIVDLLENWKIDPASPGWRHEEIIDYLKRTRNSDQSVHVFLLESPDTPGEPRVRKWAEDTGFVNLFQGRDLQGTGYKGDRDFAEDTVTENSILLQVHRVSRRGYDDTDLFTLAIKFEGHTIVRKLGG